MELIGKGSGELPKKLAYLSLCAGSDIREDAQWKHHETRQ